ncbi:MAG: tRNA (N6-threonylcarbamoyladenosine(37)-N6)-methyltransferase TrmO [Gammaproteobacteria bacterium]|nr:MAG: tRNA (N6-threonylcarbamoyladenosine(37)-N6)-methyltransferase TrmO [Gammaproteobacteria bacterium]
MVSVRVVCLYIEEQVGVKVIDLEIIGKVHSCYKEKFGVPRQPGLVTEAKGSIELLPPFNREEAVRGLEEYSHLWISFVFHQTSEKGWSPMVRPPRLGGNAKVGVFASRSMFRPNPVGLSVVKLDGIDFENGVKIIISGMDLVDGTPVVDIKPYLPYVDSIADAKSGFAPEAPVADCQVVFSEQAEMQIKNIQNRYDVDISLLIRQILHSNPAPAYRGQDVGREYGMRLLDFDLRWCQVDVNQFEVISLVD